MTTADSDEREGRGQWGRWGVTALIILVVYVLSCGPVMAAACWLREATDRDEFYLLWWLYAPMVIYRTGPVDAYIVWWFWLFGTVGPG